MHCSFVNQCSSGSSIVLPCRPDLWLDQELLEILRKPIEKHSCSLGAGLKCYRDLGPAGMEDAEM